MEPEKFVDAIGFTAFAAVYVFTYTKCFFPAPRRRQRVFELTPSFRRYFTFFLWIGLILPTVWLLAALAVGGPHRAWAFQIAGPHHFLIIAQVAFERVCGRLKASLPTSILVPVLFSARRTFSLYIWNVAGLQYVSNAWQEGHVSGGVQLAWLLLGQILAVVCFLAWSFNLFFFLAGVALPEYLKLHYEDDAVAVEKDG